MLAGGHLVVLIPEIASALRSLDGDVDELQVSRWNDSSTILRSRATFPSTMGPSE